MPDHIASIPDNWEAELELLLLHSQIDRSRQKAYIASPCRAKTPEKMYHNMMAARFYSYIVCSNMHVSAYAPQAYLPLLLNDNAYLEREAALKLGLEQVAKSDWLFLCGDSLTEGMCKEMLLAAQAELKIITHSREVFETGTEVLNQEKQDASRLLISYRFPSLALSAEELYKQGVLHA